MNRQKLKPIFSAHVCPCQPRGEGMRHMEAQCINTVMALSLSDDFDNDEHEKVRRSHWWNPTPLSSFMDLRIDSLMRAVAGSS